MKIKSYRILFRFFSFLSDKTNGAPLFVKYKLLLGTLILGITTSSANAMSKMKMSNDTIPAKPDHAEITCYKPAVPAGAQTSSTDKIDVKGTVTDELSEVLIGVSVSVKGKPAIGTITDIEGNFKLTVSPKDILVFSFLGMEPKEISASIIMNGEKRITLKESNMILCYEVVVIRTYPDDIYTRRIKNISKLSYTEVGIPPVSPVGNLTDFQNWMNENVRYNERMLNDEIEGDVILSFAIDKKGKIVDKKVIGKLSPEADKEALRLLSSSGEWTPGMHNGKKIKTTLTATVSFSMPR